MDAFEQIIGQLLEEEGLWVRHSIKVGLTKEEKREIGKPSTPRPEIDLIALDYGKKRLHLLEVKSFLDSPGVRYDEIMKESVLQEGRYKLLTSAKYRRIITDRLRKELSDRTLIDDSIDISYGLIAGKVYQNKEKEIKEFFDKKGWFFWGPSTINDKIKLLSKKGYEDNPVTIAAKLLLRLNEWVDQ